MTAYRYRPGLYRRRRNENAGKIAGAAVGLALAVSAAGHGALAHHHAGSASESNAVRKVAPASIYADPAAAPSGNAALGATIAAAYGWGGGSQWACLDDLWERESGWQNDIANLQSGAFGIAQALGHGGSGTAAVVAVVRYPDGSSASDVTVNEYPSLAANSGDATAQIRWGLGYIQATYGTPCGAWQHEEADSWY